MKKKLGFDCIIIGAGPAGLTASIYLKRANFNVLVVEREIPGGQMNYAPIIKNYPGFEEIEGPTLALNMYKQAQNLGVSFNTSEVLEVVDKKEYKIVKTKKEELTCKYLIIATGRQRRKLEVTNEENLVGRGVSYCALCDAAFFKGKRVVVIGGGNSAVEEALHLAKIANRVILINRSKEFKAEKILIDEIVKNKKIEILYSTRVIEFIEEKKKLFGVKIKNTTTKVESILTVDGAFITAGYESNINILNNLNIKNEEGYIIVDNKNRTNIKNIYACGDVVQKDIYQIVTAVNDGVIVATDIIKTK